MKFGAIAAALLFTAPGESQVAPSSLTYADLADLALTAPVAAHVRVKRASRLKRAAALTVPPGKSRFYVEAEMLSQLRGPPLPARLTYLVDLRNDAAGKPPKLAKKGEYLVSGFPVPGRPGELRLVAPDAQIPWSPDLGNRLGTILGEASTPTAPSRITAIGRAFHVRGSLQGESETQIFLQTADERPVSLNILRRPGEQPRWSAAMNEIIDHAAPPPPPNTLLWYRLACSLPERLPMQSFAGAGPAVMTSIQADYRLVLNQLGPCQRSRPPI